MGVQILYYRSAYFKQGKCYTAMSKRNAGTENYYYMGN